MVIYLYCIGEKREVNIYRCATQQADVLVNHTPDARSATVTGSLTFVVYRYIARVEVVSFF